MLSILVAAVSTLTRSQENGVERAIRTLYRDYDYARSLIPQLASREDTEAKSMSDEDENAAQNGSEESWTELSEDSEIDASYPSGRSTALEFHSSLGNRTTSDNADSIPTVPLTSDSECASETGLQ